MVLPGGGTSFFGDVICGVDGLLSSAGVKLISGVE